MPISRSISTVIVVALLALGGRHADATTLNLGSIDHTITIGISGASSSTDEYDFTVNSNATLNGTITANPFFITPPTGVEFFEAHDLSGFHSMTFDHVSTSANGAGGLTTVTWNFDVGLLPGHLYALTAQSASGYSGSLTFTFGGPAPTPIPPALLMFGTALTGLFGLGWARRTGRG